MINELLGGLQLGDIGLSGVVILIILMILNDRLITRKRYEDQREETKAWRAASEAKDAVIAEYKESLKELLSLARATHHALSEIQSLGQGKRFDSDREDVPT